MAVRIKSHWHDEGRERSLEELAGAIAFNGFKIALDKAIRLHRENFVYENDERRLGVISEYLAFQLQLADRLSHRRLEPEERGGLVTALALRFADLVQDNGTDLLGPGEYRGPFIDLCNRRAGEYGEFAFAADGPSYPFYRHLGAAVQQVMGQAGENRWVIDQVMDVDGPEVYKLMRRVVGNLLD